MDTKSEPRTISVLENVERPLTVAKLFVYGIFLDEDNRYRYKMSNPQYDTVSDYITIGHHIVQAAPIEPIYGAALTGLVVDILESDLFKVDLLESAYDRIKIKTTNDIEAYMYVRPHWNNVNHNSITNKGHLYE